MTRSVRWMAGQAMGLVLALLYMVAGAAERDIGSPAPDDGELLDRTDRRSRTFEAFLRGEVQSSVNQARGLMGSHPEQATATLDSLLNHVRRVQEINPEVRAQLVDQIEAALRSARRQRQTHTDRRLDVQQAAAQRTARERSDRLLSGQERKAAQSMARFNALMAEGRYRDAEMLASFSRDAVPGRVAMQNAVLLARTAGYTADINTVRDMRHKGYADQLFRVELSHVPTPDNPPILYPHPEAWQLLTERRKRQVFELSHPNVEERKIVTALAEKTEFEFLDQPLKDVVDYLKQRHDIEIQLDRKGLAQADVSDETPVTGTVKDISLRSALKLLLRDMDLTFVIRDEVLLITSQAQADAMVKPRVYPVGDLVSPNGHSRGGGFF